MHVTPIEQRVRNAIVAHHARWFGRAPTTAELVVAAAPATRAEVDAALARLAELGIVLRRADGWHTRPPRMTSRASEAMALRSMVR